ncbi:unnamed protein product [Polarella glacialis]|uniref:Cellulase n=1 Tax=Polarella glacialis TaxID=89957 RepID=A0A813IUF1_POLGL|nr:unnamed protein product [Polarella glacialis]
MMDVLRVIALAVSALSLPAAAVQCQAGSADASHCAFPADAKCFPGINTGMTATPSSSGECITPSTSNTCSQSVADGSKAWTWSSYGAQCCNCWQMTSTATTTTTPMSGGCPSDCSVPMCQAGNPSNGGKALVAGTCTASCSEVMGTARYCGTGSTYASTGSVNCQACAATTTTTTTTPMSGSCPSGCLDPMCQAGNPSNSGKALVAGTCTASCSEVMGTARYCGTGSIYASTGSVNCQACAATTTTTTTTPMSGSCQSDCLDPMCQAGNPSNGGKALVAGTCTASCSEVMGTARYCGTGSIYASTGSVNCQACTPAMAQTSAETHEDASMLQVKVKASLAVVDNLNETFSKSLTQEVQCQAGSGNAAYCGFNVPASGHYPNQNTCWAGINTGATATGSCATPSKNNACWLQVANNYYDQSLAWAWASYSDTCCNCWQRKDWTPSLLQGETQELPSDEDEVAHIQTFAQKADL